LWFVVDNVTNGVDTTIARRDTLLVDTGFCSGTLVVASTSQNTDAFYVGISFVTCLQTGKLQYG